MVLGGGISLGRMFLLSSGGIGQGMTDVIFASFILDGIRQYGGSKFVAFSAIAAGSLASIVCAPFAGALGGRSVKSRKYTTLVCLSMGALAAIAIGLVAGNHSVITDGPREENSGTVVILFALAVVYRAAVQSAPIVPMCIDAASHKVKGDEGMSDARISIGLSFFYINYRLGFLGGNILLSSILRRNVDRLLPSFLGSGFLFLLTIMITAIAMPSGRIESADDDEKSGVQPPPASSVPQRSLGTIAVDDIRLVLRGGTRLQAVFAETLFYGIAFGAFGAIVAPFYNEVVFGALPGEARGIEWAAYSGLIAFAVGIIHDAFIGGLVFTQVLKKFGMTVFWVLELLIGAGLFVALYFVSRGPDERDRALVLFGFVVIASVSHNFFSLVAGGALVKEPRLRPAAFGIRAACLHLGLLLGSLIAAFISDGSRGFRPVMLMSAAAALAAAAAAFVVGTVERPKFSGVAVNANPLFSFLQKKEARFIGKVADEEEAM